MTNSNSILHGDQTNPQIGPVESRLSRSLSLKSDAVRLGTHNFLLVIHKTMVYLVYCFRRKRRHLSKKSNLVVLGQMLRVCLHRKMGPVAASHLLRSLKVIRTDMDRSATYDFLLVLYSELILYCFGDKRRFRRKVAIFFYTRVIKGPQIGFPCSFVTAMGLKKLRWWLYQTFDDVHSFRHNVTT